MIPHPDGANHRLPVSVRGGADVGAVKSRASTSVGGSVREVPNVVGVFAGCVIALLFDAPPDARPRVRHRRIDRDHGQVDPVRFP